MKKTAQHGDEALRVRLRNWDSLNRGLRELTESELERLLVMELEDKRRPYMTFRIQQRLWRLRYELDKREMMRKLGEER